VSEIDLEKINETTTGAEAFLRNELGKDATHKLGVHLVRCLADPSAVPVPRYAKHGDTIEFSMEFLAAHFKAEHREESVDYVVERVLGVLDAFEVFSGAHDLTDQDVLDCIKDQLGELTQLEELRGQLGEDKVVHLVNDLCNAGAAADIDKTIATWALVEDVSEDNVQALQEELSAFMSSDPRFHENNVIAAAAYALMKIFEL